MVCMCEVWIQMGMYYIGHVGIVMWPTSLHCHNFSPFVSCVHWVYTSESCSPTVFWMQICFVRILNTTVSSFQTFFLHSLHQNTLSHALHPILLSWCEEYFTYVLPYGVLDEKRRKKSIIRMWQSLIFCLTDSLYVIELKCSCQRGLEYDTVSCSSYNTNDKKNPLYLLSKINVFLTTGTMQVLFLVTFYFRSENTFIFKYIDINKCCLLSTTSLIISAV